MKKLISALLAMALMLALSPPGHADYDPKVDYLAIMLHAAEVGDIEAGRAASICRNEQIDIELTGETKLDFDELFLLAKIICAEAGSPQLGDDWRMCVGEVVLNRVASPEFPDSIHDVVYEPGQYQEVDTFEFAYVLMPTAECVDAARRLLEGERLMEPWVVFQANFVRAAGSIPRTSTASLAIHTSAPACIRNYIGDKKGSRQCVRNLFISILIFIQRRSCSSTRAGRRKLRLPPRRGSSR